MPEKTFIVCLAALFLAGSAFSQDSEEETESVDAPERIDLSNFPGVMVDKVVIPIPAEIFSVLDKLDEPDWQKGINLPDDTRNFQERGFLALNFGSVVAEGFIAVQAKNSEKIQDIGRRALKLAESLGLANSVQPHSQSIIESAGKGDWQAVREELDGTQQTVKVTMEQLRDEDLSNLVSLGGWLRGTNVVTEFISESFSDDKAELLNQPALIAHFLEVLDQMKGPEKDSEAIRKIREGLEDLESIVGDSSKITEESVNEIRRITREMLEQFYFEPVESKDSVSAN